MKLGLYLLRRHALLYCFYWSVMFGVLAVFLASFDVFGHWIDQTDQASAWSMTVNVAPAWFVFAMGIVLVAMHLPIAIANGITRRRFCLGAAVFVVATAVLFALMKVVGLVLEAWVYQRKGLMDEITVPYPWPTVGGVLTDVFVYLSFMLAGALVSLVFYRLRIWWALLLAPLATLPLGISGMRYADFQPHWTAFAAVAAVWAAAGFLAAQGVAVRPKKA